MTVFVCIFVNFWGEELRPFNIQETEWYLNSHVPSPINHQLIANSATSTSLLRYYFEIIPTCGHVSLNPFLHSLPGRSTKRQEMSMVSVWISWDRSALATGFAMSWSKAGMTICYLDVVQSRQSILIHSSCNKVLVPTVYQVYRATERSINMN